MCEFCVTHGDGGVWYKNAKNYADDLAADLKRRQFIADFFKSTMEEGIIALGRLETIYRKKKRLPAKLVRAVEERAREEHFGQVVTIEDVRKIVAGAKSVVCLPCACRWASDKKEKRRCFSVSYSADPWYRDFDMSWFGAPPVAGLQETGKAEAVAVMEELEGEGAVHTIWTMITPFIGAICNCTPRECLGLRNLAVGLETMAPGEERALVDPIVCSGCGLCPDACHFDAIDVEPSGTGDKARIAAGKCYGCGLCRTVCPEDAITMVER